jgi:hypothetical protein
MEPVLSTIPKMQPLLTIFCSIYATHYNYLPPLLKHSSAIFPLVGSC